jgi:predicted dehydrogenase
MDWQHLKVLLVGCGSIGRRHATVLHDLGVSHIAICDPVARQRELLQEQVPVQAEYDSLSKALAARPDVVFILTPPHMHVPQAIEAMEAGCHVFCEKPLAEQASELPPLFAAIEQTGRKFMVGFCMRFHRGLSRAKDYLDHGRIGRLISVRTAMAEHLPDVRPDYRNLFSAQRFGVYDLIHEIDLALWYAGGEVQEVKALHGNISDIGIVAPDAAEILIAFDNHCYANVHLDFFRRPRLRETELTGTQGVIRIEYASWTECTLSVYEAASQTWFTESFPTERNDMFRDEDREFLQAVALDQPIRLTAWEGRKSLAIIDRARGITS